jgi:hypothetical protein
MMTRRKVLEMSAMAAVGAIKDVPVEVGQGQYEKRGEQATGWPNLWPA